MTEAELVEVIQYQLAKSLDLAIYDAVADFVQATDLPLGRVTVQPEGHENYDPEECHDDAILLPSGRVAFVEWHVKVVERDEV